MISPAMPYRHDKKAGYCIRLLLAWRFSGEVTGRNAERICMFLRR
jgi:hypothetical protein